MECAVLFADIAGSTALYEVLGDERAFALVHSCLSTLSECTAEFHGRVVKTIGDAVMAVFDHADAAAGAAAEMQIRVADLSPAAGVQLGVRIGFHYGPVVERDGDVWGDTVNLASRLCDLASRGQIITDRDSAGHLSGRHAPNLRQLFAIPVKGKERDVELVELMWQVENVEMTTVLLTPAAPIGRWALLELRLDGTGIDMGPERRKVTFGRDDGSDFAVRNPNVSRAHATIERRRERFVLADHSLNGTYVTFEGEPETRVHHEELTLVGHGWIAFGQQRSEAQHVVEFRCVETQRPGT